MPLPEALTQWLEKCDSSLCNLNHQKALHGMCAQWVNGNRVSSWIIRWLEEKSGAQAERWGEIMWCQLEERFQKKKEEKNRMFERSIAPEVRSRVASIRSYLRNALNFQFRKTAEKDFDLNNENPSEGESGDEYLTALEKYEIADAKIWKPTDGELETHRRIEERGALAKVAEKLRERDWSLIFLMAHDIGLGERRLTSDDWKEAGLPGQAHRYELNKNLTRDLEKWINHAAREALSTEFQAPQEVDVMEVYWAQKFLLPKLYRLAEEKVPEKFRATVFRLKTETNA